PSAAVSYPPFHEAATRAGLRLITYSRPGYGASTPRRPEQGAPRYADDIDDSMQILDQLGAGDFVTLGWSGGGPRALGCAALLPGRCRAAATLAGVGPMAGLGEDWFDGMAPENRAEYAAAGDGPDVYGAYLESEFLPILQATAEGLATAMGELLTPVDLAAWDEQLARTSPRAFIGRARRASSVFATTAWPPSTTGASTWRALRYRRPSGRATRTPWCPSVTASGSPLTCPAPGRISCLARVTSRWRAASTTSSRS
ncbi:MAG: alpha/beta fold hydrolase, partial [Nocardioides sp.]